MAMSPRQTCPRDPRHPVRRAGRGRRGLPGLRRLPGPAARRSSSTRDIFAGDVARRHHGGAAQHPALHRVRLHLRPRARAGAGADAAVLGRALPLAGDRRSSSSSAACRRWSCSSRSASASRSPSRAGRSPAACSASPPWRSAWSAPPTWPRPSAPASRRCRRGRSRPPARSACPHSRAMVSIVIPQAFRIILPPLTNELILLTKDSSLVYLLGYTPTSSSWRRSAARRSTRRTNLTPLVVISLCYLLITVPLPSSYDGWKPAQRRHADDRAAAQDARRAGDRRPGPAQVLRRQRGAQGHRLPRRQRPGGLRDRPLGLRQVHAAALRQPARGADVGQDLRRGHRDHRPRRRRRQGPHAGSAWSSSRSTCSRT